ncbi:MAG: dihydrofolate reductase family protein, partial [Candidatus Curtissbacteria bacterium]
QPGRDMAIFGSNNLAVSLVQEGLVDEFRIMVNPVAIGAGTPLFAGIEEKLNLKLINTKAFGNGNVLLSYQPVK